MTRKEKVFAAVSVLLAFSFALLVAEIALRILEAFDRDEVVLDYKDTWRELEDHIGPGGWLLENFEAYVTDGYGGKVRWKNNSQGFRADVEYSEIPAPGVLRILSLGDSFTAGYRVGQEETFSYLLEQWLTDQKTFGTAEVMISCIENPAMALYYLDKQGQYFHPHVVLMGITLGNDLAGAYIGIDPRGRFTLHHEDDSMTIERNIIDDPIGFRHGLEVYEIPQECLDPNAEPLERRLPPERVKPGISRIWTKVLQAREQHERRHAPQTVMSWYGEIERPKLFDYMNGLGMYLKSPPEEIDEAYMRLFRILAAMQALCRQRGMLLVVALFPQRFQVQPADWKETIRVYGLNEECFGLNIPNQRIEEYCREAGIAFIDPTPDMEQWHLETRRNLYCPGRDMHWNKEGHRAFYECFREPFAALLKEQGLAAEVRNR